VKKIVHLYCIMRVMEHINIRSRQIGRAMRVRPLKSASKSTRRRGPILAIAEFISADASELLTAIVNGNPKFHKLLQLYKFNAA